MLTKKDLQERYIVIREAKHEDITILSENYRILMSNAINNEEREQYRKLVVVTNIKKSLLNSL